MHRRSIQSSDVAGSSWLGWGGLGWHIFPKKQKAYNRRESNHLEETWMGEIGKRSGFEGRFPSPFDYPQLRAWLVKRATTISQSWSCLHVIVLLETFPKNAFKEKLRRKPHRPLKFSRSQGKTANMATLLLRRH